MTAGSTPHVLIVDDEAAMRDGLAECLGAEAYDISTCADAAAAQALLARRPADALITDLVMPDCDGMELLEWMQEHHPGVPVIMITGYSTVATAVEAMRRGAFDYLPKPFQLDEVRLTVRKALQAASQPRDQRPLRQPADSARSPRTTIIGQSAVMRSILAQLDQVAVSDLPTLITGETGTGKELLAREIHRRGPRAAAPFLSVNCAALPDTLLESELFGHARGAFTGAAEPREGLFQAADGGTLFLDEIGDISAAAQARLLRVLQDGEIRRLGENTARYVNVRIIAATNQPLPDLIRQKHFREDLYFRLNVVTLSVPPLRERLDDLPLLAQHLLDASRLERGLARLAIDARAMAALGRYDWPGNVRELENVMRRAAVLCRSAAVTTADLPPHLASPSAGAPAAVPETDHRPGDRSLDDAERRHITSVLRDARGNISQAARILGISRPTLRSKIEKYGIDVRGMR
jgi:DNA-binding NtrC family response regulator